MWNLTATAAAVLILLSAYTTAFRLAGEKAADASVCHQLATTSALRDAAVSYVLANNASLGIAAGTTVSLDPAILTAAGGLSSSWQNAGPYDSSNAVRIRNTGTGFDILTLSHGGNALDERQLRASVTCGAPGLAFVDSDSPATIITASYGERAQVANFDSPATPVEAGRLMFLDHIGPGQVVPPYLHRFAVPGTDANRMHTAIDMNSNDVDDAGTVNTDTLNAGDATVTNSLTAGTADVIGDASVGGDAAVIGSLTGSSAQFSGDVFATNYWHLSDRREKTDIRDVVCKPISELRQLQPKSYRWRSTGETKISYIAQDVQAVLPEFVRHDPHGRLVVMQSELNLYMMRCLLEPSLTAGAPAEQPRRASSCPARTIELSGTRAPGSSSVHSWEPLRIWVPEQPSGTGTWAGPAGGDMARMCPRLWSACSDQARQLTCRRSDNSIASHPVARELASPGGSS